MSPASAQSFPHGFLHRRKPGSPVPNRSKTGKIMLGSLPPSARDRFKAPTSPHSTGKIVFGDDRGEYDDLPPESCRRVHRNGLLDLIKSCWKGRDLEKVRSIHAYAVEKHLLAKKAKNACVANALITAYAKCDAPQEATALFNRLPARNLVSWNALISGYAQNGLGTEALRCFDQMEDMGSVTADAITYTCVLKACGMVESVEIGEKIDAEVRRRGLLKKDLVLGTALVDMYARCGCLQKAREVFDLLPEQDVVSWSILIAGYVQQGLGSEALECFRQMKRAGISPDAVTYSCISKACGIMGSLDVGEEIDAEVRKRGLLGKDIMLGTAIVDMYCKCGALGKAAEVFKQLPMRNVVSWTALISGYAQNGLGDEALACFGEMKDAGIAPNAVTYIAVSKACAIVQSVRIREEINAEVRSRGLLETDAMVGNALVDMHAKCGALEEAREVFELLSRPNIVCWNALMAGYSQLGQADAALDMYRRMRARELVVPDSITFLILLNACSHAGLVREGEKLFDEMDAVHRLTPTLEHYTCMADLFGRAGRFDKLKDLLGGFPEPRYLPLFQSILGSCIRWQNVELGRWAFEQSIHVDDKCSAAYACMGNIYAAVGAQTCTVSIEAFEA